MFIEIMKSSFSKIDERHSEILSIIRWCLEYYLNKKKCFRILSWKISEKSLDEISDYKNNIESIYQCFHLSCRALLYEKSVKGSLNSNDVIVYGYFMFNQICENTKVSWNINIFDVQINIKSQAKGLESCIKFSLQRLIEVKSNNILANLKDVIRHKQTTHSFMKFYSVLKDKEGIFNLKESRIICNKLY